MRKRKPADPSKRAPKQKLARICRVCQKTFMAVKSQVDIGCGIYCNNRCRMLDQRARQY